MQPALHVIFGAGQVGHPLAEMLLAKGLSVRIAKRSGTEIPAGAQLVLGDAANAAFCTEAVKGASLAKSKHVDWSTTQLQQSVRINISCRLIAHL